MKILNALFASLLCVSCCACRAAARPQSSDELPVRELQLQFLNGWSASDSHAISALFREDAGIRLEKRLRHAQVDPAPRFRRARLRPSEEAFAPTPAPDHWHPIPNVPPSEGAARLSEDAGREDLVRARRER